MRRRTKDAPPAPPGTERLVFAMVPTGARAVEVGGQQVGCERAWLDELDEDAADLAACDELQRVRLGTSTGSRAAGSGTTHFRASWR